MLNMIETFMRLYRERHGYYPLLSHQVGPAVQEFRDEGIITSGEASQICLWSLMVPISVRSDMLYRLKAQEHAR